jgi:ADP-heptose:LPS heptosyltransferase
MRILFITSSRIGDAVISSGILERLRLTYPRARITVAVGVVAQDVFAHLPDLERLIVFDKEKYDFHWLRLWLKLAGKFWDIVVDVRGSAMPYFLLAKQRKTIKGGRRPGRRYEQLGAAMGWRPAPLPVAWTNAADAARAELLLPPGRRLIGLGPTSALAAKMWPPERFAAAYQALAGGRLAGARPVIFAGPGAQEQKRSAPVLALLPDAIDLTGRLTLTEVAACMRKLDLFIGNDSGLMHLAAAAGTPTLGLFGPSHASQYAPAGRRVAVAIAPGPEGAASMALLTVDTVLAAAARLLAQVEWRPENAGITAI